MNSKNSFFLVIEGLDGSGKTEMARRLSQVLRLAQNDQFENNVLLTFEPHDPSCAGLYIRQVLTRRIDPNSLTLALAFTANRLDHCDRVIRPFLVQEGKRFVICDRYYLSSIVYQADEELTIEELMNMNRNALKPDLTLFLNANDKVCAERMKKRDEEKELFEKALTLTRNKYQKAITFLKERGETIIEIDANGSQEEVLNNMMIALNDNAPEWLRIQPVLSLDYNPVLIDTTGSKELTLAIEAHNVFREVMPFHLFDANDMHILLNRVSDESRRLILDKNIDELGLLFLDYLRINRFSVGEKFAWSDVDAFYVNYPLPMAISLRGVVILGNEIHKELIVYRKMAKHNFDALSFIFLFLPSVRQKENYFESEFVITASGEVFAPSIKRFYKADIVSALILQTVKLIQVEFSETISAIPEVKNELYEFCNALNLIN